MNKKLALIFTLCGLFAGTISAQRVVHHVNNDRPQHVKQLPEAEKLASDFASSYDSLLNSYTMRTYARTEGRYRKSSFNLQAFDMVPDTVIAKRLRSLHTVIPMTFNDDVRAYIRMYLNRMSTRLDAMLALCDYYHPLFQETLNRYNVPEELKYLTIVESAMNPAATSRVGAAGLWQFMYTTGKNYDLEVNSIIDERRDTYKSTEAAAHYLHDLYRIFNDWTLAIAAYNCGPGNINKAISRSGGKTNFWEIYPFLPRETRGYIPAFIAVTYVMNFYPEHGLRANHMSIPLHTDTVMVERDMYFHFINKYTQVSIEELRSLNPQYRTDFIPGSSGSYPLCLPTNKMDDLIAMADSIFIASEDSVKSEPVINVNYTPSTTAASGGKKKNNDNGGSNSVYHKVRKGETLSKIAQRHGTTINKLKKLNGLKSDKVYAGQRLRVR